MTDDNVYDRLPYNKLLPPDYCKQKSPWFSMSPLTAYEAKELYQA